MRFGHFDDAAKEYVIDRPDTPRSWSNYIGSRDYGGVVTNNAGGYSFYKSAALGRFLRLRFNAIPMDQPGRYFYLRDAASGDYWSTSWQPVGKPLDTYATVCRHGTGYSVIQSRYDDIESEVTYFVPEGKTFEYWRLKVTNQSNRPRKLQAISYCEFASNWSTTQDLVNLQYSAYTVKAEWREGMIRCATNDNVPPDPDNFTNNDQGRWSFMAMAGIEPDAYELDRERFIGPYRAYHNPLAVETGRLGNSTAHGDNACGGMRATLELASGESKELLILLGVGKAEVEGKAIVAEYGSLDRAEEEFEKLKQSWHAKLGAFEVKTPDDDLDHMVNVWNAFNSLMTFSWSRTASLVYNGERDGYGFRDTLQDCLGVLALVPEEARERIELMLTGQDSLGGALEVLRPFHHRPGQMERMDPDKYRSDDCLWFFNAVPAYVAETGDVAFYDKVLPYCDEGKATVLGHLRRALEFTIERSGANGLPCGLSADWNDCLRLGYQGESLFVAFQLRYGLSQYIEISELLEKADEATWAREELAKLDAALAKVAWDGAWFIRAIRDDGSVIGSKQDPEGSIFLNAQSWAVLSGAADDQKARSAMDEVHARLATEYGIMVCTPPFAKTDYHVVRAVLINEGQKENGGIFSHTQGWAVMAECLLGRGDRAYEYYRAYMPAAYNDRAEEREVEPYVHCQSTHSKFSGRFGASRIPWLSGTATWTYFSGTQYLLGIRPELGGLRIDPCIPKGWPGFAVRRKFRGCWLEIDVQNPRGVSKGVARLTLDGKPLDGNLVPVNKLRDGARIVAELG